MRYFLFVFFLSIIPIFCFPAEDDASDSLKKAFLSAESDSLRIDAALGLGRYYSRKDPAKAIEYAHTARQLAEKSGSKNQAFSSLILQGVIYKNLGKYDNAVDNYLKALNIAKSLNDDAGRSVCLNNLGSVYQAQNDLDQALDYFQQSLEIEESLGIKENISLRQYNLGTIFELKGKLDRAYAYYYNSLLTEQEIGNQEGIYYAYYGLAGVDIKRGNYENAKLYLNKALELAKETDDFAGIAICLLERGKLHKEQNNIQAAIQDIRKSIRYADKVNFKNEMREGYFQLADLYSKKGRFENAFSYQRQYIVLNDSLSSVEMASKIAEIKTQYKVEEKEREIAFLQEKEELLKRQAQKEKRNRYFLLITLVIAMIFALANLRRITSRFRYVLLISVITFVSLLLLAAILLFIKNQSFAFSLNQYFVSLLNVFSIAVLPIFLAILIAERVLMSKRLRMAKDVSEKISKLDSPDDKQHIVFVAENNKDKLDICMDCLLYLEASDNYSAVVYLENGNLKKTLLRGSLTYMEKQTSGFENVVRCHRSYIVNILKVSSLTGNAQGYKLHFLETDIEIPVSRRFPKEILQKIRNWLSD